MATSCTCSVCRAGELRRDDKLRTFLDILRLVIVELVNRQDFSRHGSLGVIVPQHGAFDLAGVDSLFDQNFPVVLRRQIQCGRQFPRVMNLADPHGRSPVHRLHKQRVGQFLFNLRADDVRITFPVRAEDEFPGNNGKVRVAEQALHHILIHACRGGKHAGSDVGNIRQFQKSLDGTILAKGPVQDGENDVECRQGICGWV